MDAYDMDIDPFVSQAKSLSQHAIATSQHPQTISIKSQHEMMHSDWSIPMSLAHQRDLNSESDLNSYPFNQQLMLNESNAANELPQSHLDLSGDLSATESDSATASQSSTDDPIVYLGRPSVMVIEESKDEMYAMYWVPNCRDVSFESNTTLVNPSPARTICC
jgi:hypothetical protein